MAEQRLINNLKGIMFFLNVPILDFEIEDRILTHAKDLSDKKYYPHELAIYGVTYGNINAFFQRRTMKEGCMYYREHLRSLGMDRMDFDKYIKMKNGNNNLDNYWIKFENYGAKSFEDICNQDYPVKIVED